MRRQSGCAAGRSYRGADGRLERRRHCPGHSRSRSRAGHAVRGRDRSHGAAVRRWESPGTPFNGKDLHIGDFDWGILPPAAPLGISTMTIAGMAMAFEREGLGRVGVSFIGDGGSSLGEWHEAINLCAAGGCRPIFCVENNHLALSTPVADQSAVRVFADKAAGYGIPGMTIDGTDPDQIAAAFAWAAERARAGDGPALIELVSLRMCGHAHHDDMLYLGRDPHPSWDYPPPGPGGYRRPGRSTSTGRRAIRFRRYAAQTRSRAA